MIRDLERFTRTKFDLLVVGGGINGAAIAHLAAAAGAGVALVEKNDFASGTSSKSTKLLHGGIRYLENFEFDLVHESLKERYIQWQAVPYLARPMAFTIPVYKNDQRPLWMMKLGVWLYDLLSGQYRIGNHRFLSPTEIIAMAPGINTQGLVGGVEYHDVQMDDARICLENVLMADKHGAAVANYLEVQNFIKDDRGVAIGAKAVDLLSGQGLAITASKIIVAAGPWADRLMQQDMPGALNRLRPTKGVHIVYKGEIASNAFLLQSRQDRRIFFVIPFKGNTLIGTTDTDYHQSLESVHADDKDVQYLLQEAGRIFPNIGFERNKIITTFAGLRPLVTDKGAPSRISRKHAMETSASGICFVMGGKYTTYRAIAQDVLKQAMPELAARIPRTAAFALFGSGGNEEIKILSQRFALPVEVVKYLQGLYGSRSLDVLKITQADERAKQRICSCSPAIVAQLIYARRVEMAQMPLDIIERRLGLSYLDCPSQDCRRAVEEMFQRHP